MNAFRILTLAVTLCVSLSLFTSATDAAEVAKPTLKKLDDRVRAEVDGELFGEFIFKGLAKPIVYPIHAPGQVPMTRNYPMKKGVKGEASDHPHHRSLWFTHGVVNGVDFWHEGSRYGKVEHVELVSVDDKAERPSITTKNKWIDPKGKVHCTDTTTVAFGTLPGARTIDWTTTIHATNGDVTFGDTKEGIMGLRTHPQLRLDKGGKAVNSKGATDRGLWGKHANWVHYYGKVGGKPVGVAIFDHPQNLRSPTTWHARHYGLVAANPFGLRHFQKKPAGAGNYTIKAGEELTFRYRFVFHEGSPDEAQIADLYKAYAKSANK